jgi:hypothetical protein
MYRRDAIAIGRIAGKVESPVENNETTGQHQGAFTKPIIQNKITTAELSAIRDRTLNKLKVGRQSTQGKAINAFIKELSDEITV